MAPMVLRIWFQKLLQFRSSGWVQAVDLMA